MLGTPLTRRATASGAALLFAMLAACSGDPDGKGNDSPPTGGKGQGGAGDGGASVGQGGSDQGATGTGAGGGAGGGVSTVGLQFITGFEDGVDLPQSTAHGNSDQYITGGDVPGYAFPLDLWDTPPATQSWVLSVVGPSTPEPASSYAGGELRTVTGHDGDPTRVLELANRALSPSTDVQQVTLQNYGLGAEPVLFQRMRVKFAENTLARAQAVGETDFWQIFWEVKAEPDYRLRLQLRYDEDDGLYWHTQGDALINADAIWEADLRSVPVVMAPDSSADGWHEVAIWMNRPGGQFKVAIDGVVLIDRNAALMGDSGAVVDQLKLAMLYSTVSPLTKTMWDDLEIWSVVPDGAWPE
jgi:hypothetical protein